MVIKELYIHACQKLKEVEKYSYSFEVFQLMEYVLGVDKSTYPIRLNEVVPEETLAKFNALLERRIAHEPLQYILGQWEFFGLPFKVGEGVLIPRADTEIIAETAIDIINKYGYKIGADLCSGSGTLAIALAKNTNMNKIYAIELSKAAFFYLEKNIKLNNVSKTVYPLNEDIFSFNTLEKLDIILSNPPYIPSEDIKFLSEEVRREPALALDGGEDGLNFYRKICKMYYAALKSGGALVFEIGINQREAVEKIMAENGYTDIKSVNDLGNIPRCIYGLKSLF